MRLPPMDASARSALRFENRDVVTELAQLVGRDQPRQSRADDEHLLRLPRGRGCSCRGKDGTAHEAGGRGKGAELEEIPSAIFTTDDSYVGADEDEATRDRHRMRPMAYAT